MMKVLLASAMVAISAGPAVLHAEAQENTQTIEGIVAIVNDQPISYSDVRERASLLLLTLGA